MVSARIFGHSEDRIFVEAQIVAPAADMLAGRPALLPAGQGGGIVVPGPDQFPEEFLGDRLARLRALLLLYWFT